MAPQKINVKERYSDGEIDLSMSDLQDVPVKDIAVFNKTYKLDLSNNNLRLLPGNFASLTFLCALDLSKNQLGELPENFGDLVKLKYLDLYQNQLTHLPLSFSKLKLLRWLDLKDNPLVPAVAKVAGPCLDSKECLACAKDIVNFFSQIQDQISTDMESRQKHRQKQLDLNQKQKEKSNNQKKKEKNKKNKQSQQQQQQQVQNGPAREQQQPQPRGGGKSSGKKAKQQQQPTEQQHHWSRFLRFVCYSIFWTVIALFVLTSIKFEYTKNVETAVVHLYSLGLENIPATWQPHYSAAGSYVKIAHLKTANATVMVFECLSGCINYENLDRLKSFVGNLTETVVQKYRQYTS